MPYICIHRHQNKFILFTIQAGIVFMQFLSAQFCFHTTWEFTPLFKFNQ